jgi:hypothetical protein
MWKRFAPPSLLVLAVLATALSVVALSPFASAAPQRNAGDVWIDTVGHVSDPGHENDPHVCNPIDIYGNGLADSSGTFEVIGWPPTGDGSTVVASGAWSYNQTAGGNQVIAGSINLAQGHYQLTVSQDPKKSKVFWSTCAVPTPTPTGTGAPWPFTP